MFLGFALPKFTPPPCEGQASFMNSVQFLEIFNRITNVALSRFKWHGLPKSCNERALEITLYFYGKALFFDDPDLGLIHTPVNLNGPFNIYYESVGRQAYSFDYERQLDITNSVVIRNNKTMTPSFLPVWTYAPKIADGLRAIDVHSQTLKRPYILSCQEKQKQSIKAMLNKIGDNEVAIVGSQDMAAPNKVEVLNTSVNCMLGEMWANVKNYMQQVFTALGVESRYQEKKERLIVAETEGETNVTRHVLESALQMREVACEEINNMFGTEIYVEVNQIDRFPLEAGMLFDDQYATTGGEDNEEPG